MKNRLMLQFLIAAVAATSVSSPAASPQPTPVLGSSFSLVVHDRLNDSAWVSSQGARMREMLRSLKKTSDPATVELTRQQDSSLSLRILNTSPADDTEPASFTWKVKPDAESEAYVEKLVRHYADFSERKRSIKKGLMDLGIADAESKGVVDVSPKGDYYVDGKGNRIGFDEAFKRFSNQGPRQKYFLRSTLEMLGLLGIGTVWYFRNLEFNSQDWDIPFTAQGMKERLLSTKYIRFDNNNFVTNQVGHPVSGMGYYLFARSNGYKPLEAYLFTFATSAIWEWVVEIREKISINDQIMTPLSGMAMGEVLFQLGNYFNSSGNKGSLAHKILSGIFGLPAQLHRWIDSDMTPIPDQTDNLGLSRDYWHRFSISTAMGVSKLSGAKRGENTLAVGLKTELISIPGVEQPGQFDVFFAAGNHTKMDLNAVLDAGGIKEFSTLFQAALFGYYWQKMGIDRSGELKGTRFMISGSTAYYFKEGGPTDLKDQFAVTHILGPTMSVVTFVSGVRIEFSLDVFADFAVVRSFAFSDFRKANPAASAGIASATAEKGYYFAVGGTIRPELRVEYKRLQAFVRAQVSAYQSISGLDRHQEKVSHELDLSDTREEYEAGLSLRIADNVRVQASATWQRFRSKADNMTVKAGVTRYMGSMIVDF